MGDLQYLKKKYNVNKSRDPNNVVPATFKKVQELNSNNRNDAFIYQEIGAEMENEESKYLCIEEVTEETLKLQEVPKSEFLNEKYQDLINKENQQENIDDETRTKIRMHKIFSRLKNLDMATINKILDEIDAIMNKCHQQRKQIG